MDEVYEMITDMLEQMECLIGETFFNLRIFTNGLSAFGYKDLELPKSKRNMDFRSLDLKSIRVLNRLS